MQLQHEEKQLQHEEKQQLDILARVRLQVQCYGPFGTIYPQL